MTIGTTVCTPIAPADVATGAGRKVSEMRLVSSAAVLPGKVAVAIITTVGGADGIRLHGVQACRIRSRSLSLG
eukprot:219320-Chlamydomonas_euryale.AAC.1